MLIGYKTAFKWTGQI